MKIIIKETNVCSLIIGKTSEESHSFISTLKINVQTGDPDPLLTTIRMAALMNISASIVMAGKNKNTILKITSLTHASMETSVLNLIALTFTEISIEDSLFSNGLRSFQRLELLISHQITICPI